jgi:hypothetical protein
MLKSRLKYGIAVVAVFIICTCIDQYSPNLKVYDSLLAVDGLITDANVPYIVKLSRTLQNQNDSPPSVSDAIVSLTDDAGNNSTFINTGSGIYKTDSTEFRGIVGRTYVLHIATSDGKEYESEPCLMYPVPGIDSIYFLKDQQLVSNGTQTLDGVSIYLDSKGEDNNQYYRWAYEETWKFRVPYPKKYDYIKGADPNFPGIAPVKDVKEFCWKNRKSDEILTGSVNSASSARIEKEPILFIGTDQSDRLLIQYSILVSQYSISKKEYDFWNNLKQINESGGDIFAKQPFTVISNIKNINNPAERVLGYFQVSAVKQKRKNISFSDLVGINLPVYHYPCERLVKEPNDYPNAFMAPPPTWTDLYSMFCITSNYYFVEPLYSSGTANLQKMVFAKPECADCELTGIITKPDFWIDINGYV